MQILRLTAVAAVSVLAVACGRQEPPAPPKAEPKAEAIAEATKKAEPLKVGFVYVSPIGDAGWTTQHNRGREQMQAALGDKVTTTFVEKVPEGADAERVIRDLASQGHRLIFTTSFGFMNPTLKVAESDGLDDDDDHVSDSDSSDSESSDSDSDPLRTYHPMWIEAQEILRGRREGA